MKLRFLKIFISLMLIVSMSILPMVAQASGAVYILMVTEDWARIRYEDGTIESLRAGTKLMYLYDGGNMQCWVSTTSGKKGYIYRGYVKVYGAYSRNRIGYNTENASLYVRNGEHLEWVATLPAGEYVFLLRLNGNWAQVRLRNGKTCYMSTDTLAHLP